jgi:hypothetical protein
MNYLITLPISAAYTILPLNDSYSFKSSMEERTGEISVHRDVLKLELRTLAEEKHRYGTSIMTALILPDICTNMNLQCTSE